MVISDGAEQKRIRRGIGNLTAVIVALVAAGVLLVGFGALTAPGPEAAAETSTTTTSRPEVDISRPVDLANFSVSQIARGEPLAWHQGPTIRGMAGGHLIEYDGRVFIVGQEAGPVGSHWNAIGWRMDDSGNFEQLILPPGLQSSSLTTTSSGLIGVAGLTTGEPSQVVRSPDGMTWGSEQLPSVQESPLTRSVAQAIGANDDLTAIALSHEIDVTSLVTEHYEATTGSPLDVAHHGIGWEGGGDSLSFVVYGPLGITLYRVSGAEVGVSEADQAILRGDQGGMQILTSYGGSDWWPSEFEGAWVEEILPHHEGGLAIYGHSNVGGRTIWVSREGSSWERESTPFTPYSADLWGGGLVGQYDGTYNGLVVSTDGASWRPVLEDAFPLALGWYTYLFDGGPGGIAAVVEGWSNTGREEFEPGEPIEVTGEGGTLTFEPRTGVLTIQSAESTITMEIWNTHGSDRFASDLQAGTVGFLDLETGETLVTVTIEQLQELEQAAYGSWGRHGEQHSAMVFSSDAETWVIQDAGLAFGEAAQIMDLLVTESELIALVIPDSVNYNPFDPPDVQLWTASLP